MDGLPRLTSLISQLISKNNVTLVKSVAAIRHVDRYDGDGLDKYNEG